MPHQVPALTHVVHTAAPDFGCEHRAKSVPPETDLFIAYGDRSLQQQILDISMAERISNAQSHRHPDHLRRKIEISERTLRIGSGFALHRNRLAGRQRWCHVGLTIPRAAFRTLGSQFSAYRNVRIAALIACHESRMLFPRDSDAM